MPQITSVEPQKTKKGRFNIFIDGKFSFGTTDLSVIENNLKVGKSLDDDKITKIIAKDELAKLTDLASRFLSYRPRSEEEVRIYLIKKVAKIRGLKFAEAKESKEIEIVINKLKRYKYINDLEFAKWFLQSRLRSSPRGKMALKYELRQKGIENDLVEKLLGNISDEKSLALKSVGKKVKRWKKLSDLDFKKKVYQHLSMRGFSLETIKETFAFLSKKR